MRNVIPYKICTPDKKFGLFLNSFYSAMHSVNVPTPNASTPNAPTSQHDAPDEYLKFCNSLKKKIPDKKIKEMTEIMYNYYCTEKGQEPDLTVDPCRGA